MYDRQDEELNCLAERRKDSNGRWFKSSNTEESQCKEDDLFSLMDETENARLNLLQGRLGPGAGKNLVITRQVQSSEAGLRSRQKNESLGQG